MRTVLGAKMTNLMLVMKMMVGVYKRYTIGNNVSGKERASKVVRLRGVGVCHI